MFAERRSEVLFNRRVSLEIESFVRLTTNLQISLEFFERFRWKILSTWCLCWQPKCLRLSTYNCFIRILSCEFIMSKVKIKVKLQKWQSKGIFFNFPNETKLRKFRNGYLVAELRIERNYFFHEVCRILNVGPSKETSLKIPAHGFSTRWNRMKRKRWGMEYTVLFASAEREDRAD